MDEPAPAPLATAAVYTNSGTVVVPCEPINEWLAITPVFSMDMDGKTWLDGTFSITHLPTGQAFSEGSGCINCCRRAAAGLLALDADWSLLPGTNGAEFVASLDEHQKFELSTLRELDWSCDADYCDEPDDEEAVS